MLFILGAKGSAWAWRNKRWESVEHFRKVQRKWAIWSLIVYVGMAALTVGIFMSITVGMKSSEAYKLTVEKLQSNSQAVSALGAPINTGLPTGNIQMSGSSGSANMSFSAEGTISNGTVYFKATKDMGQWTIEHAVLKLEDSGERINLD